MKTRAISAVLLPAMFLLVVPAHAGPIHLGFFSNTAFARDAVLLAQVLPERLSSDLAERAENVNRVTRERLWRAVLEAAATRGIHVSESLRPGDLHWSAPAGTVSDGSTLVVRSVKVDHLLNQIRFFLRSTNQPSAPSISAWYALPAEQRLSVPSSSPMNSPPRSSSLPSAGTLVSIRRSATLHLHSENSSAILRVRVLQSGELGEIVRVRMIGNGHTLSARVAGPDFLDAMF